MACSCPRAITWDRASVTFFELPGEAARDAQTRKGPALQPAPKDLPLDGLQKLNLTLSRIVREDWKRKGNPYRLLKVFFCWLLRPT